MAERTAEYIHHNGVELEKLYFETKASQVIANDGSNLELHLADYTALVDILNTISVGSTGYQKLPSGIIIQWGEDSINLPESNVVYAKTVTLPIAYPNNKLLQMAVKNTTRPDICDISQTYGSGTSSFQVHAYKTGVITSLTFRWISIGN